MKDSFSILKASLFKPALLISLLVLFFFCSIRILRDAGNRVLADFVRPVCLIVLP